MRSPLNEFQAERGCDPGAARRRAQAPREGLRFGAGSDCRKHQSQPWVQRVRVVGCNGRRGDEGAAQRRPHPLPKQIIEKSLSWKNQI